MTVSRTIWGAVWVSVALIWGCGTRGNTPVGSDMLDGHPGRVVELPLLPLSEGKTRYEWIQPLILGTSEDLWVGQMNSLVFRTLLRFGVPADSLARAAGAAGAADLKVTSIRVRLTGDTRRQRQDGAVSVLRPKGAWDESSVFADTLAYKEIQFPSAILPGAAAATVGDSLFVDLPVSVGEDAIRATPHAAQVDVLLAPSGAGDFLKVLMSKEAQADSLRPRLFFAYSVGGKPYLYRTGALADTYWGGREEGKSPAGLFMSAGISYAPLLRFDLPDSIPPGATVNLAQFLVDVDEAVSYYDVLPFRVDLISINAASGDTTFVPSTASTSTTYIQYVAPSAPTQTFAVDRTLIQGWVSGRVRNDGMALRPQLVDPEVDWVVFLNPRLRVVYSLPPSVNH